MPDAAPFSLISFNNEPRVSHFDLAERLEVSRPVKVRELIERNKAELETYGTVSHRGTPILSGKGREQEATEYLLNEQQALLVCMFARTEKAAKVRRMVIDTYMQHRRQSQQARVVARQVEPTPWRVRSAKMQLVNAVSVLDDLGIDVTGIDMTIVLAFSRNFLSHRQNR